MTDPHRPFIDRCLELGQQAKAKGNPAVGAVIVKAGKIIAEAEEAGRSKGDITCHAEIEVVRAAVQQLNQGNLSDCVLYSSHEPCVMCAYVIRYHKIKKVYYLNAVPSVGGINSSHPILVDETFWPKFPPPQTQQLDY